MTNTAATEIARVYTATKGTTAIIDGRRGIVTSIHYSEIDHSTDGAFVRWDDGGMAYVETGARTGNGWHEVASVREIGRDEFDALTGLARIRHDLGWRA